jgi:hypothetical protein
VPEFRARLLGATELGEQVPPRAAPEHQPRHAVRPADRELGTLELIKLAGSGRGTVQRELEHLASITSSPQEAQARASRAPEIEGLIRSGSARIKDAEIATLSISSLIVGTGTASGAPGAERVPQRVPRHRSSRLRRRSSFADLSLSSTTAASCIERFGSDSSGYVVEPDVECPNALRQPTHRKKIDAGRRDGAGGRRCNAAGRFRDGSTVDDSHRLAELPVVHVVEKDGVNIEA